MRYPRFTLPAALLDVLLEVPAVAQADSPAQAALAATCDMHLRVELSPHVPDTRKIGIVSSLLSKYPDYRLTLQDRTPIILPLSQSSSRAPDRKRRVVR